MSKFLATLKLTYFNKLKSKAFMISTILFIIVIVGLANVDKIIQFFDKGNDNIAIVTQDDRVYQHVKSMGESLHKEIHYEKLSPSKVDKALKDEKIDRAYVIKTQGDRLSATIKSTSEPSEQDQKEL